MKWTKEEIDKSIQLLAKGLNFDEVGVEMGRSRDSIRNKMNKMGITWTQFHPAQCFRLCLNCGDEFKCESSSANKFCGHSCSATFNNKLRSKTNICFECGVETKNKRFCSRQCNFDNRWRLKCEEIERGECTSQDTRTFKKYLIGLHGEKCMVCGWCEVNPHSGLIPLELHHKDGNPDNNKVENLIMLCPNHHALQDNWKGSKTDGGRHSKRRTKRRDRYAKGLSH